MSGCGGCSLTRKETAAAGNCRASAAGCCWTTHQARAAAKPEIATITTRFIGAAERRKFPLSPLRRRDRKSTGLNSSHTVISYAVFCLKKKTQEIAKIQK